jgi:hypothetical protein
VRQSGMLHSKGTTSGGNFSSTTYEGTTSCETFSSITFEGTTSLGTRMGFSSRIRIDLFSRTVIEFLGKGLPLDDED